MESFGVARRNSWIVFRQEFGSASRREPEGCHLCPLHDPAPPARVWAGPQSIAAHHGELISNYAVHPGRCTKTAAFSQCRQQSILTDSENTHDTSSRIQAVEKPAI